MFSIGTVCVIDTRPRPLFDIKEKQLLVDIAAVVGDEIELFRRNTKENQR